VEQHRRWQKKKSTSFFIRIIDPNRTVNHDYICIFLRYPRIKFGGNIAKREDDTLASVSNEWNYSRRL
jgi:hypothetical protein